MHATTIAVDGAVVGSDCNGDVDVVVDGGGGGAAASRGANRAA
jgi:hypothetical protein